MLSGVPITCLPCKQLVANHFRDIGRSLANKRRRLNNSPEPDEEETEEEEAKADQDMQAEQVCLHWSCPMHYCEEAYPSGGQLVPERSGGPGCACHHFTVLGKGNRGSYSLCLEQADSRGLGETEGGSPKVDETRTVRSSS